MSRKHPRRYWDANAFLGVLRPEKSKLEACKGVLKAAAEGKLQIVTSALTLVEVIKLKGHPRLEQEKEERIRKYFMHEWLIMVDLDRGIAEAGRQLLWEYEALNPKDAVHVATALAANVDQLDTFDGGLIKLTGKLGKPPLVIGHPNVPEQLELMYEGEEIEETDDEDLEEEE